MKRLGWRFPALIAWTAVVGLGEGLSIVLLLPLLSQIGIAAANNQGLAFRLIEKGLQLIGANEPVKISCGHHRDRGRTNDCIDRSDLVGGDTRAALSEVNVSWNCSPPS